MVNASSQGYRARRDGPLCITSNHIICLLLTNDSNEEAHLLRRFPPNEMFSLADQEYQFLGKSLALDITSMNKRVRTHDFSRECYPYRKDVKK